MPRRYAVMDVFTDTPFCGNQLGLIPDARGLDGDAMQAITREFNYAETVFLAPAESDAHDLSARIFTPGKEIPFAGHPNIGLGVWAAHQGEVFDRRVGDRLLVEEGAGVVALDIVRDGEGPHVTLTAPAAFSLDGVESAARIAACGNMAASAISTQRHEPTKASVGMGFFIAELASPEDLARARPVADAFDPLDEGTVHEVLYYVRDGDAVRARMFACSHGIPEDAATGSAAAALAALLAHLEAGEDAGVSLNISQGVEMGRPSQLLAFAEKRGGLVTRAGVGGRAVMTMSGELLA